MVDSITTRIKKAWNVFTNNTSYSIRLSETESTGTRSYSNYSGSRYRSFSGERSLIQAIYTRIAIDFAEIDLTHARVGENGQFLESVPSQLNEVVGLSSNIDQSARAFKHDLAMSLFELGHAVVVPVDTTLDPNTGSFDVLSMRIGKVTRWYPNHVTIEVYNQKTGRHEEVLCSKETVAIIENPFYSIMNEHNSTLQRLLRKLQILDSIDEQIGSGKLDIIIQLPYVIKTEARRIEAEKRRKDIEMQLKGAQYGIAYTDGTERITQLNRPTENNLLKQVEYLTEKLYTELGLTAEVVAGTADVQTMLNYTNRTIGPIRTTVSQEFSRKFLTKTARTQGQRVLSIQDPFKTMPVTEIAELADKFTRNEIATSNEIRGVMGWRPSKDPKADELRNANISAPSEVSGEKKEVSEEGKETLNSKSGNTKETRKQFLESLLSRSAPIPAKEKDVNQNET